MLKKENFNNTLLEQLSTIRDSASFWKIINRFRYRAINVDVIYLDTWHLYFELSFTHTTHKEPFVSEQLSTYNESNPFLDPQITQIEVVLSLKKCKDSKAPGSDNITYEFLKSCRIMV